MDKKEIQDVTREYFKSIGFQILKKTKFYYESKDLVIQVWMNHSNFSNTYYIDYYIRIKNFHPEISDITNDKVWDTHFSRLTNNNDAFIVEYEKAESYMYIKELNQCVVKQIMPIIEGGNKFLKDVSQNEKKYPYLYILFTNEALNFLKHV